MNQSNVRLRSCRFTGSGELAVAANGSLFGRSTAGGAIGELQSEFARLAKGTFRHAWRRGPDDPAVRRVVEILRRAADEVEQAWNTSTL